MTAPRVDPALEAQIPPLTADELASLKGSILAEGCRDALVVWQEEGILLDGHHRLAICENHDIAYRVDELSLPSREAAEDWIDAHQLGRRNLSAEAMSLLRGRRYNRTKRQGARTDLTSGNICPKLDTSIRLAAEHGVSPRTVKNDGAFARAVEKLKVDEPDIEERILAGKVNRAAVTRKTKSKIDTKARQTVAIPDVADATGEGWSLYAGDFSKRLMELEPGSVTLIVTDPPYPAENLPLWRDLAECAKRVLCPGGVLLGLTGQIFLPDVMRYLGEFLDYGWTYAQPLPGSHSRILGRHITQAWKPWLAYSNGPWPSGRTDWHDDLLTPGTRSKDKYHWQQDPAPVADLIDKLAPPGSIVCDPFSGTGAYGALCLRMGRRFIGCELDAGRFDLSRKAMEEASLER